MGVFRERQSSLFVSSPLQPLYQTRACLTLSNDGSAGPHRGQHTGDALVFRLFSKREIPLFLGGPAWRAWLAWPTRTHTDLHPPGEPVDGALPSVTRVSPERVGGCSVGEPIQNTPLDRGFGRIVSGVDDVRCANPAARG